MINRNPALTPEQILRQTSLAKDWHRITISGKVIQVAARHLEAALEAAYDPAERAWLNRIECRCCDGMGYLCVNGRYFCDCLIL